MAVVIIIVIIGFASKVPDSDDLEILTGTPADNFSEKERAKFCGTSDAKSSKYVKEYQIPTDCTQPQAITMDPQGNVWFAQSNTGRLAKFNPLTETFTEYDNMFWPAGQNSMIWGLDYSDGSLWFTDDKHDSVWKFETDTRRYDVMNLQILEDSLPQRLQVEGSKIILNDFTGSQIVILDEIESETPVTYALPSNSEESVVGDFTIDSKNNLWYTNWILEQNGILARVNQTTFDLSIQKNEDLLEFVMYTLPSDLKTPNGITSDDYGKIWITDSSNSLIFKFDPITRVFSKYPTNEASSLTYGNYTGQINSTASKPYWIEKDSTGRLVFNEQGANRIGVLDPDSLSLVEYEIPSRNPNWGDCANNDCGLAQVFDFTIGDGKVWFTEWAENKIGFVDTSSELPFSVGLESAEISIKPGDKRVLSFSVFPNSEDSMEISPILSNPNSADGVDAKLNSYTKSILSNSENKFDIEVSASKEAISGEFFILMGAETENVTLGQFLKVIIE